MLLPNKFTIENNTILGAGAVILNYLNKDKSLSDLWDDVKMTKLIDTYEMFVLGLDLLFLFGLITFKKNKIIRLKI